ncbi:hypothetical protein OFN33_28745, partial [Escherichia coli]|nr:hypothetical protein [Escherichia coli]
SNAASKTLFLVELLKGEKDVEREETVQHPEARKITLDFESAPVVQKRKFGVNKWLLAATIIVALISIGIYFWSSNAGPEASGVQEAKN